MNVLIVYEGFSLYEWGNAYKSLIDDEWRIFDTAGQWKQFIDLIKGRKKK